MKYNNPGLTTNGEGMLRVKIDVEAIEGWFEVSHNWFPFISARPEWPAHGLQNSASCNKRKEIVSIEFAGVIVGCYHAIVAI